MPFNYNIVVKASASVVAATNFVTNGSLSQALLDFGDVDMQTAYDALNAAKTANNPIPDIDGAVICLRRAHVQYKETWAKLDTVVGRQTKFLTLLSALRKDKCACCLLAVCLVSKKEFTNAESAIKLAKEANRVEARLTKDDEFSNPIKAIKTIVQIFTYPFTEPSQYFGGDDDPIIYDEDFKSLCRAIDGI